MSIKLILEVCVAYITISTYTHSCNVPPLSSPVGCLQVKRAQRFIEGFHIKYRMMPDLEDQRGGHHGRDKWTVETVDLSTATMYVLINLQEYTWYEIRIQPFYMTVEGQDSNTVRVRTFEAGTSSSSHT